MFKGRLYIYVCLKDYIYECLKKVFFYIYMYV